MDNYEVLNWIIFSEKRPGPVLSFWAGPRHARGGGMGRYEKNSAQRGVEPATFRSQVARVNQLSHLTI